MLQLRCCNLRFTVGKWRRFQKVQDQKPTLDVCLVLIDDMFKKTGECLHPTERGPRYLLFPKKCGKLRVALVVYDEWSLWIDAILASLSIEAAIFHSKMIHDFPYSNSFSSRGKDMQRYLGLGLSLPDVFFLENKSVTSWKVKG